jgi:hypothetical protein
MGCSLRSHCGVIGWETVSKNQSDRDTWQGCSLHSHGMTKHRAVRTTYNTRRGRDGPPGGMRGQMRNHLKWVTYIRYIWTRGKLSSNPMRGHRGRRGVRRQKLTKIKTTHIHTPSLCSISPHISLLEFSSYLALPTRVYLVLPTRVSSKSTHVHLARAFTVLTTRVTFKRPGNFHVLSKKTKYSRDR